MHHIVHQHSILNPSIDYADDREQNGQKGHWYEQDKITYRARRQDYLQELYSYECSNEEIQYWEYENAEFSHPCRLVADSFDICEDDCQMMLPSFVTAIKHQEQHHCQEQRQQP